LEAEKRWAGGGGVDLGSFLSVLLHSAIFRADLQKCLTLHVGYLAHVSGLKLFIPLLFVKIAFFRHIGHACELLKKKLE
jgi:hypothetical protein